MGTAKVHLIRPQMTVCLGGSGSLWVPAHCRANMLSLPEPDIYAESTIQLFPLGTKLELADGRVFRYGKVGATSTRVPQGRMVGNQNVCPGATGGIGYEGTCNAAAAGAAYVDIDDTDNEAENYYEDGTLAVYPSGHFCTYRIAGSEAYDQIEANHIRLYLDTPVKTALVAASTGITAYPSVFSNMVDMVAATNGVAYTPCLGVVSAATFTSGSFCWVQRKGLAIVTPTAYFGDSANEREAQCHSDGCIALRSGDAMQTIGYLAQQTYSGYGDLEVWLTIE